MKKHKKVKLSDKMPKYKYVVPYSICIFILIYPLIPDIHIKEKMVMMLAVFCLAWFAGENIFPDNIIKNNPLRDKNKSIWIMAAVFVVCAVLSQILTADYGNEFQNYNTEFESLAVLLSYLVLFFISYNYFYMDKSLDILKKAVLTLIAVIIVMSIIEFLDIPIAALWTGNREDLYSINRVILSFDNSNYYGCFCCMLLPFAFECWLHAKNRIGCIAGILLNTGIVFCILVSKSTLVFYLQIAIIIAMTICEIKAVKCKIKEFIVLLITLSVILLVVNGISGGKLGALIDVSASNGDSFEENENDIYELKEIDMEGNKLTIYGNESKFSIVVDENIAFYDSDDNIMDAQNEDGWFVFKDEAYKNVKIEFSVIENADKVYVKIGLGYKDTLDFYIIDGEFKGVGADLVPLDSIEEEYTFHKFDNAFTGRGYIWIRTLPKLKEVILIGKGPGNFVYNYDQYDYAGLMKIHGTHKLIINRPHNIILQYCMDIGIIGTLALCGIVIYTLVQWISNRIKYKKNDNWISQATFFSIIVFCIFSMLNDSIVTVSPYMWIFLGINMSVQYKIKKMT